MNYFTIKQALSKVQPKNFKRTVSLFLLLGAMVSVFSAGTVKGVVTDAITDETLIGASILVKGSTQGTITNIDGQYELSGLAPGTYTLIVQSMSYEKKLIPNVVVKNGTVTPLDIQMAEASFALDNVVVVAKANGESENILLMEQKKAVVATQAVGAKEMSRKGISDAEGAVAQVSGVSKQEGVKNVFVRGLGDRFNNTTLNGMPIPSEDPEYKNISLDFFGSDVIKNIGVSKVFSASHYGDVGGAVIDISSKELIGDKELSLDVSGGSNNRTIGADLFQADGANSFGFASNTQPRDNYKTDYTYGNSLDPTSVNMPVNTSYGFTAGKRFKLGKDANPLSFLLVGSNSTSYSYTKESISEVLNDGTVSEELTGYKSSKNINQLLLSNINFLTSKHEFNYNFVMIHNSSQSVGKYMGNGGEYESGLQPDEYLFDGYKMRQQINDNLLYVNQLIAKISLTDKTKLDAGVSYNHVTGNEPDRRIDKLSRISESEYILLPGDGSHVRNYSELIEDDFNGKLELSYQLPEKLKDDVSSVHLGYNGRLVQDEFEASEYSVLTGSLSGKQTLNDLVLDNSFNQANFDNKKLSAQRRYSTYSVSKIINSGYASLDYQFNTALIANLGVKADLINLDVTYDVTGGSIKDGSTVLDGLYVLPSMNIKYNLNTKHSLRMGLSKTYTLPQSKEISPYLHNGKTFDVVGNPDLVPSQNYNADLKWDYYISTSELLSLSTFGKYIQDPIARTYFPNGAGYFTYDNVSDHALVAGVELEMRKNIFNMVDNESKKDNKLTAGINASYIYSNMLVLNVEKSDKSQNEYKESQLEGAAPILLNLDLSYNYSHKDASFTNSLVLSYFSDRVYTIGTYGVDDIIEKGIPTLNFVSISNLNKHFSIKLKAKNILDAESVLTSTVKDVKHVLNSFYKGTDFSLGLSYKF